MKKKHRFDRFCCPGFVPPGTPDDFCIPENCCPKQLETPKFPSPSTCLPKEQQRELEEKIEAVNKLLLDLALSNKHEAEGAVKSFDGLIGLSVEVLIHYTNEEAPKQDASLHLEDASNEKTAGSKTDSQTNFTKDMLPRSLDTPPGKAKKKKRKKSRNRLTRRNKCGGKRKKVRNVANRKKKTCCKRKETRNTSVRGRNGKKEIKNKNISKRKTPVRKLVGRVLLVGRDFVLVKKNKMDIILPLSKVHSIKPHGRFAEPGKEPALQDIDPCLRRSLTFHFGETVASSPELIHLFFKMTLPIFLLHLIDKKIIILLSGKKEQGIVHEVDKESLTILTAKKEMKIIPYPSISLIVT